MFRLIAVAIAIPTMFAAWAGPRLSVSAQNPPSERVTLTGCVARQTGAGTAPTPEARGTAAGPLLLTRIGNERSYELAGPGAAALSDRVSTRVEVAGTVVESTPATTDTAHPSSPRSHLTVASFRPLGGACPLS